MIKRILVFSILSFLIASFTIYDYLIVDLPETPYNYSNIAFPDDVVNNLSAMDNMPASNPITDNGATLGRVLFYDVDLSRNHTISCSSCHIQKFSFTDTARFSVGFNGGHTKRNSMGLMHARFQKDSAFFWDNRARTLEIQTLMPIQDTVEMGLTLDTLVARVSAKPFYAQLFNNAFGSTEVTTDRISKALAQFIRSMNTFGSKFRRGVDATTGNPAIVPLVNFTAEENLGKSLFMDESRGNCQACHTRNVMVPQGEQNIGLDLVYADNGAGAVNGAVNRNGKFSVPSLMNIELTAPYMHDGRFKTLEEVVDFYSDSIKAHPNLSGFLREIIPGTVDPNNNLCLNCPPRRPHFSPTEKKALVAFLKTLTDTILTTDVRWSNPFSCGSHTSENITACDSVIWNGRKYFQSGTYLNKFTDANGCFSVDTLHLSIIRTHSSLAITSCESYIWHDDVYTESGIYLYNYINSNNCESTDSLLLTINHGTHNAETITACENYNWHGEDYNTTGIYTYDYTNAEGCSSTDTLYLTINNGIHNVYNVTSCINYEWNGVTYTSSGVYTYTYNQDSSCPSVDTLYLTINNSSTGISNIAVCNTSLPYTWNGTNYSVAGTYTKHFFTSNGCDSLAILNLTISSALPSYPSSVTQTLVSNQCGARVYRHTASITNNASGYIWTLPSTLGGIPGVLIDSGDINRSRIIKVKYLSNAAAATTDSIRVRAFSGCGLGIIKSFNITNTVLSTPSAPTSITITPVSATTCGARIYRYSASTLTAQSSTVAAATGYQWTLPFGDVGSSGVLDSGSLTGKTIRVRFSNNKAFSSLVGRGDSIRVAYTSACGNSPNKTQVLTNLALNVPLAPASITITAVAPNVCGSRVYRYAAPLLTSATATNYAAGYAAATGYLWSFTGNLGANAVIDSGNINSRVIRVRYTNNDAAVIGDSVKVAFTSACGNSFAKASKLTNTALSLPAAPASITISPVLATRCAERVYRYTAPSLPVATSTSALVTGWLWVLPEGPVGSTGLRDSAPLTSQVIRVRYSSNEAHSAGDSIWLMYTSGCGNGPLKAQALSNLALNPPSAPASITVTPIISNVCGERMYRYTAPILSDGTATNTTTGTADAVGYLWSFTGNLGSNAVIDSGDVNSRTIVVKYSSNAAAETGDSVRVAYTSLCGNSLNKSLKLTNTALSLPAAPASITITPVSATACGERVYRYTAPVLPASLSTTALSNGWLWELPSGPVGSTGIVDSGDVNSRIIRIKYSSNSAAGIGDSIKVAYTTSCGNSPMKVQALSNLALNPPAAPALITVTSINPNSCGERRYRYAAPLLPSGTAGTTSAGTVDANGYIWSFTGNLGSNAVIDSGDVNSRTIVVKYSSNDAAETGDSVRVAYTSQCGNSLNKSLKLTNTVLSLPAAPASITITPVSATACGERVYRYTAPVLPVSLSTTALATGWLWELPSGPVGSTGIVDSGDVNSRIIRIKYSSNSAAGIGDSIKVAYTTGCGNSPMKVQTLSNLALNPPAAPASISVTSVSSNACNERKYRYTASLLTAGTATNTAAGSTDGVGYLWSFTGNLGSNAVIDSGDVNSRTIVVKYSSNAAAETGDSVRVAYTSLCGNSLNKSLKLTNTALSLPAAPASITITPLSATTCGERVYRYTAPVLPVSLSTTALATGWLWQLPSGPVGSTGIVDSGDVNSRIIRIKYSSNSAAGIGDSIKLAYTTGCGNSPQKIQVLSNLALNKPSAPLTITQSLVSDTCGSRVYRFTAPLLPSGSATNYVAGTASPSGYLWSFTGNLGAIASIDSGTINSRIVKVRFASNAAAVTGDSARVAYTSSCGTSINKTQKLTNASPATSVPATPGLITKTVIDTSKCDSRLYRFSLPTGTGIVSYDWSFTSSVSEALIDSGRGSRVVVVRFTSPYASLQSDSIKVRAVTGCFKSIGYSKQKLSLSDCNTFTGKMISSAVKEENEDEVSLYPNPSNSYFTLRLNDKLNNNNSFENYQVKIMDMQGRVVKAMKLKPFEVLQFGAEFNAGNYIVEINKGKQVIKRNIIKL